MSLAPSATTTNSTKRSPTARAPFTKHKMKNYLGLAKEFQDRKLDDDAKDGAGGHQSPRGNNNAFQDHDKVVATIFGGLASTESRRERKLAT